MINLMSTLNRKDVTKMMLGYKFALEEMNTKISILLEEYRIIHEYNPIEHVSTRIKSPKSILRKIEHRNLAWSLPEIEDKIRDIAGVRIVCSFEEDIYRVAKLLTQQCDIQVIEVKDYIQNPKRNGYRSLHLIVKVPVFLTDSVRDVFVEIQIRTIAMDFWASLEHKIYYKYNREVPADIVNSLKEAAEKVAALDFQMASLNKEVNLLKERHIEEKSQTNDIQKYIQQFMRIERCEV